MLPHPTRSSFSSAIASRRYSFRWIPMPGGRIVFADPSALKHLAGPLAQRCEAPGELAAFVVAHGRSAGADRVALDDTKLLERGLQRCDGRTKGPGAALEGAREAEFVDRSRIQSHQLGVARAADLPCALPFARHRVGRSGDDAVRSRALRQVAVPVMAHAIGDTFGRCEQIEDEVGVAGVDRELVAGLEVRGGARVVADDSFTGGYFDSANVWQPRHRLNVARMQMCRLARRRDVGIVIEE